MRVLSFIVLILIPSIYSSAQIGINNSAPDEKSVLDLKATNKGLLIPRMTSNYREAMSSGSGFSQGMMVYDTDLDILFVGYGNGASGNKKWYAMNPWKTEYRRGNNVDTANMTAMTVNPNATVGNSGIHYGNVGIGIPVPTEKLDVNGWTKSTGFIGHGTTPLGGIIMWSGRTAPSGWALCNGGTVNGYKTPNLKGRFVVGYDNSVVDYNNPGDLSTKGAGPSDAGGAEWVTLSEAQMPRHTHKGNTNSDGAHSHSFRSYIGNFTYGGPWTEGTTKNLGKGQFITTTDVLTNGSNHRHAFTTDPTGFGRAHENRPPYYTLAYIMRVY